jgi:hypothetical protein
MLADFAVRTNVTGFINAIYLQNKLRKETIADEGLRH